MRIIALIHLLIQGLHGPNATQRILFNVGASLDEGLRACHVLIVFGEGFLDHRMQVVDHVVAWAEDAYTRCLVRDSYTNTLFNGLKVKGSRCAIL